VAQTPIPLGSLFQVRERAIGSRRQLNDLPDDLAAKITINYYVDARDALLKAIPA
jgi:hypothetical protein